MFGSSSHPATLAFSIGGTVFTSKSGNIFLVNTSTPTLNTSYTNSGTFQLAGNSALTITGDFANSGSLFVDIRSVERRVGKACGGRLRKNKMVKVGRNKITVREATV